MKRKILWVWVVLTMLAVLMMAPGSAAARATWTDFTGTETPLGPPLDPGVWNELPSGNVHVRGMVSQSQEVASDVRMSGVNTVVMNANWGPTYAGPMWGTSRVAVASALGCEQGGVWQGTWTGTMNVDGSYSYRAVGKGLSGCVKGLHYALVAFSPADGGATTYVGQILDPHGE